MYLIHMKELCGGWARWGQEGRVDGIKRCGWVRLGLRENKNKNEDTRPQSMTGIQEHIYPWQSEDIKELKPKSRSKGYRNGGFS